MKEPWRRQGSYNSEVIFFKKLCNQRKEHFNQLAVAYPELNQSYNFSDEAKDEVKDEETEEEDILAYGRVLKRFDRIY